MEFKRLTIPDLWVIKPKVFEDTRGFFYESFSARAFQEATRHAPKFVQENHSKSVRGVLRGLHYQLPPHAQGKLLRVLQGEVFDVAVDIRKRSPTFGKWLGNYLSQDNKTQKWIPPGFAHGFLTLSESAEIIYTTTAFYEPSAEAAIAWNDPDLNVEWPLIDLKAAGLNEPILSGKDQQASSFKNAKVFE